MADHDSHACPGLLDDPRISAFLDAHPAVREPAARAARVLEKHPDGAIALRKILPALERKVIKVFFSYKAKDEPVATAIVKLLRAYSAEKLEITYMGDFGRIAGQDYQRKIKDEICQANWFILLLPDPSEDWDWCLFESGMFDRRITSADRLICLHHPETEIPDPLRNYNAVPASRPSIENFLRTVFVEDDPIPGLPAINRSIEDEIPRLAEEIAHAIQSPRRSIVRTIYGPWVQLELPAGREIRCAGDLDGAKVLNANAEALAIFDFAEPPKTWGELCSHGVGDDAEGRWRDETALAVQRIAAGRRFAPIHAVLRTRDNRIYRPIAYAVDRLGKDGPIHSFHLGFTEDLDVIDNSAMPKELSNLATLLRFAFRFRWEVLEKFGRRDLVEDDLKRLQNAFHRLESEWASRDIRGSAAILACFRDDQQDVIIRMMADWREARNPTQTGTLDRAIADRDLAAVPAILAAFLPVNQAFLEMAADRFSELVSGQCR